MAKRRKVTNLLALTVLAFLTERPMHPYELAATMRERGTEQNIRVKWGSLYTVVGNLERHGFIEATGTSRQGRRPERTVYAITELGRVELSDWMRELLAVPEREPRRFQAALSLIAIIPPDHASWLLEQRLRVLQAELAGQEAALARLGEEVPRIFLIEMEYELAVRRAEAEWLRRLLAEIREETLPGLAAWRQYHTTGQLPPEFAELAERGREPE